jgi:hypothetical protein
MIIGRAVTRLLARLGPERTLLVLVLFLGVTSVGFLVTGPRILGDATSVLFDGIVGKQLPVGLTRLGQLLTSVLTTIGVMGMMVSISPSGRAPRRADQGRQDCERGAGHRAGSCATGIARAVPGLSGGLNVGCRGRAIGQ